jgi:uncharacterized protein YukE
MTLVDPSDLASMARALAVRAEAVAEVREKIARLLDQATWTGAGAARFRFNAEQFDRRLAEDADDLRRLMTSFQRLADALEEELRALHRIEDQVRAWYVLNPTLTPPWPPSSLPPRGDPQWREVERAFVQAGVALDAVPVAAAPPPPPPVVMVAAPLPMGPAPAGRTGDWKATLTPAEAYIIERESNFDPTARNPESGAFGIWQGLGSTLDTYANRFGFNRDTTDPWEQLTMFRAYVEDRYGTAEAAVEFWKKNHWY